MGSAAEEADALEVFAHYQDLCFRLWKNVVKAKMSLILVCKVNFTLKKKERKEEEENIRLFSCGWKIGRWIGLLARR